MLLPRKQIYLTISLSFVNKALKREGKKYNPIIMVLYCQLQQKKEVKGYELTKSYQDNILKICFLSHHNSLRDKVYRA